MTIDADIFLERVIRQVPRILGLGDRRKGSGTAGCFDRYYWHYRFHDWSNARFQEAAYLLALVWDTPHELNPFAKNDSVREWAIDAINFWSSIRHGDGSVDELYPWERSFCATAFTAVSCLESARLLNVDPPKLEKTLRFLDKFDDPDVSNQRAASTLALLLGGKFDSAKKKAEALIASQDEQGFFLEYGGSDIGYQTITLGLMCGMEKHLSNADGNAILNAKDLSSGIDRGVAAVEAAVDEYGRYDNSTGSRQTQYLYPYAFACRKSPVVEKLVAGLKKNVVLEPGWLDDRYVVPLCIDYMLTYREIL